MAKIYRVSDRIRLKIDGLVVTISPLSFQQKMEVQSEILKGDAMSAMRGAALAVQYAIKDISGLKGNDGSAYSLEFDGDKLSDKCLDDLFNLEQGQKLAMVSLNLLEKVPTEFQDPNSGEPLEGVSIMRDTDSKKK